MKHFDYLIVGAGLTGSVIARQLAERGGTVLVQDRRTHIGGNVFDEYDKQGILVQRYGVHVFHTDDDTVFSYLSRFTEWINYSITCLVSIQGKMTDVPFNFRCIDTFWSSEQAKTLKEKLLNAFPGQERVPVYDLINSKDRDIQEFGQFLFENDYRPYTCKQWGRKPEEIDLSILGRVKVALSYDNRYFSDKYQCMPAEGFTALMTKLLDHPNIEIELNKDSLSDLVFDRNVIRSKSISVDRVVYTGAIDRLFSYQFGPLPYRTLRFEYTSYPVDKYLDAPFIAYPLDPKMSRRIEFKSITMQKKPGVTTVLSEYPEEFVPEVKNRDPLYPIICDKNTNLWKKYQGAAARYANLYLAGRLADYKYYDMDDAVFYALKVANALKEGEK
jgi:UDP-galactopyranose mutase